MTTTPDISSLSLGQQRIHDSYDSESPRNLYHFQTSPPIPAQSQQYNPLNLGQSPARKPARAALPSQWLDNTPDTRSLSPPSNHSDFSSAGGSPPLSHTSPPPNIQLQQQSVPAQSADDEIIPTAIVIKNIPFNVKRETLLDIISSLSIPTPYAFNYHLDQQGAFRGLAFANFRQASDADAVVAALNGFDVQGRKLRVEYKKVLQAGEKERIEREKAIRRMRSMQLEKEQSAVAVATPVSGVSSPLSPYDDYTNPHPPMPQPIPFNPQRSFSSSSAQFQQQQQQQYSPPPSMPLPQWASGGQQPSPLSVTPTSEKATTELDLNDPSTLEIYSRILLFKDDRMRDELAFSRTLSPKQRRVVHLIAQKLGVYHYSVGEGEDRYAVVTRIDPQRMQRQPPPHTLSRTPSSYLSAGGSQQVIAPPASSLRVKKSMPDLKTLHSQPPRLTTRASNGNIRDGYATIASPSRRVSSGFASLFSNNSPFNNSGSIPPVPSLPPTLGGLDTAMGVVRQPRGPGVGGFNRRESRVGVSEGSGTGTSASRARSDSLTGDDGRSGY